MFLRWWCGSGRMCGGCRRGGARCWSALRVAVFLAIVAGMLRPTHVFTEMKRHRATLIVLVDRSKSMSIADQDGESRWEMLRTAVQRRAARFPRLERRSRREVLHVRFGDHAGRFGPEVRSRRHGRRPRNGDRRGNGRRAAARDGPSAGRHDLAQRRRPECALPARRIAADRSPGDWPIWACRSTPSPAARNRRRILGPTWP